MEIIVQKNGAQQGPYTLEEIRSRIECGTLLADDWGWHPDLSDWVRLRTFFDDVAPVGTPPTDSRPAPAAHGQSVSTAPGGETEIDNRAPTSVPLAAAPRSPSSQSNQLGCSGCLLEALAMFAVVLAFSIAVNLLVAGVKWICGVPPQDTHAGPSPGASRYEREIRDGVNAFDPNYKLTPEDERMIRKMADEMAKEHPK